jgi:hypothetical protein
MSSKTEHISRRAALLATSVLWFVGHSNLLAAPVSSQGSRAADDETIEHVLAQARTASGWDNIPEGGAVRVRGAARLRGVDVLQTLIFDRRGRTAETFEGRLSQTDGFDGRDAWTVDWSGTGRVLALGDLAAAQVSYALLTGGWVAPLDELDIVSVAAEEGAVELGFAHTSGLMEGVIVVDPTTYLARSARVTSGSSPMTWVFADYEDHAGVRFPGSVVMEQAGLESTLATATVELLESIEEEAFEKRLTRPDDTRFKDDVPAAIEVKRVPTGHLLVHPLIGGKDLGWFIFDSGAGTNCISTHVADQLAEGPFGEIPAKGIGGIVMSHLWRADDLELGPVTVEDPIFLGLDLSFLKAPFGVDVAGILGYEFLSRCTVEFDLEAATIALFAPEAYSLQPGGRWEEAILYGRHPCVKAAFEGREGVFKIDTGAAGDTVTLHYDIVDKLRLTEGRETVEGRSGGVGGMVSVRNGRLESFVLGGREYGAIPASFAMEDKGAFSDASTWGNIGGKLLEPFVLVFDYPHKRIGFVLKEDTD